MKLKILINIYKILELDKGTGKSKIKLKNGYKVVLGIENDISHILGYDNVITLDQELNISPKMCNVYSANIYISRYY